MFSAPIVGDQGQVRTGLGSPARGEASLPMTEDELITRIEHLEIRLMHQEAALEELTNSLLVQGEKLREQGEILKRMAEHLREALPSQLASRADETPPPHY